MEELQAAKLYDPKNPRGSLERAGLWDEAALQGMIDEEAVAFLAERWRAGEAVPKGVAGLMERIMAFLERLRNVLHGQGFQRLDDVFERIDSGEVAGRTGARGADADMRTSMRTGETLDLDAKKANMREVDDFIETLPREQRRPINDKFDMITTRYGLSVTYELVDAGKPLWTEGGDSNSIGTFVITPAQRNVRGVEITNSQIVGDLQRQGLGTIIYDMVDSDFAPVGGLSPSPRPQLSAAAQAFWQKRLGPDGMFSIRSVDMDLRAATAAADADADAGTLVQVCKLF
jgi:hypothetical protein